MDLARIVWEKSCSDNTVGSPEIDLASLSNAVQWIRNRFNECLDKAEDVKRLTGSDMDDVGSATHGKTFERISKY
jgi:hypothetical protein